MKYQKNQGTSSQSYQNQTPIYYHSTVQFFTQNKEHKFVGDTMNPTTQFTLDTGYYSSVFEHHCRM